MAGSTERVVMRAFMPCTLTLLLILVAVLLASGVDIACKSIMSFSFRTVGSISAVIIGSVLLSTLAIDAVDGISGNSSSLLASLFGTSTSAECPAGMVSTPLVAGVSCVFAYEAAPATRCPQQQIRSGVQTQENLSAPGCVPVSQAGKMPWTFISREEAARACALVEARLPTAHEWYEIAVALRDPDTCVIATDGPQPTGSHATCVTSRGIYDLAGNVWEWVRDDVDSGLYRGRQLPDDGYIQAVDSTGVPTETGTESQLAFAGAYFYTSSASSTAIIRGGFFGSRAEASIYTTHTGVSSSMQTQGIGFRCVQ